MRESVLYMTFQVFLYLMQSLLANVLPLTEYATRLDAAKEGRFTHVEEPLQALRADPHIRLLSQDV